MIQGAQLTFRQAYSHLERAQKGHARGAPAYSVYVNRRLGRVLAAWAHSRGLSPNMVSGISAAHTFLGMALLLILPVSLMAGAVVAALFALGYAWDSADGQVARLGGTGSPQGEWLDHFIDALKLASLHLVVLVALFRVLPAEDVWLLIIPVIFSITSSTAFAGMLLNDLLKSKNAVASTHVRGGGTLGRSLVLLPTDFGVVCLVFLLWGFTPIFLVFYGALAGVSLMFILLAAVKWFREMGTLTKVDAA